MNTIEFDISEYDDDFPILDFFNKVNGLSLNWKISYLYCVGDKASNIDILSLEKKVNNSLDGLYMSGVEVFEILSNIYQIYDITMAAMDKKDKELFVLEIIDGGFVSLKYKDNWIIDQMNIVIDSIS